DYNCNEDCEVLESSFSESGLTFGAPVVPSGAAEYAHLGPVGIGAWGGELDLADLGRPGGEVNFTNHGNCPTCNASWVYTGALPLGSEWKPAVGVLNAEGGLTFIVESTDHVYTYYQLFWHSTQSLSGTWVKI